MRGDRDMDNPQILQAEEKEVVSSVAPVLSDLYGPREWMPMRKLHTELLDQFGNVWHHTRVRKYLTGDDWSPIEADDWEALVRAAGAAQEVQSARAGSEFVSLVSLLS